MSGIVHFVVDQGPEKGLQLSVPPQGARLGRSSKNDIVLSDPMLSRHHCRFFFKPNEGLWIADLGSANETMVNKKPIQEVRLARGDIVAVGDTLLRVLEAGSPPAMTGQPAPAAIPVVDLGLSAKEPARPPAVLKLGRDQLILILCVVTALAAAAWVWKWFSRPVAVKPPPVEIAETAPKTIEFEYEKVEGTPENIFRYYLTLKADGTLSAQIDDLQSSRHLPPEQKKITPDQVQSLIRQVNESGFFGMKEQYPGIPASGVFNLWDLSITVGKKHHRITVQNRVEPEAFKDIREKLETFGKIELGLWAIQVPPERLKQLAEEAYQLGHKLYDDREVKMENLAMAVKTLRKAHSDLKSIEPKPAFYAASLALLSDCEKELQVKYEEYNFQASRALNVQDWRGAAQHLRTILEILPDQDDPRNQEARTKLLEVEHRLQTKKK